MKNLPVSGALVVVLCLVAAGVFSIREAQSQNVAKIAGAAKLYRENCASCHGADAEGSGADCMMMSGPNLLSAVRKMDAKAFRVGETNMCAGHLLDLSSANVEAIRNYLLELSKQTKSN